MSGCMIVINPVAGEGDGQKYAEPLTEALSSRFDLVQTVYTRSGSDFGPYARQAADQGCDTYFVVGGDGTVSDGVNAICSQNLNLNFGFLPLGTVNDLGRALGFSLNPVKDIEGLRSFYWDRLDIGQVNDAYFIDTVAFGRIPMAVSQTSDEAKTRYGYLAYVKDGMRAYFGSGPQKYLAKVDGETLKLRTKVILVALTNSVAGIENLVKDASINDGYLYLLYLKNKPDALLLPGLLKALSSGYLSECSQVGFRRFKKLEIQALNAPDAFANVDGCPGPDLPVRLQVLPSRLTVMRPDWGRA